MGKYRKSLPWFLPSLCFSVWGRRRKLGLSGGKKTAHNAKTIWQPADCERMEEERGENTNRFQVFAHSILENAGWPCTHRGSSKTCFTFFIAKETFHLQGSLSGRKVGLGWVYFDLRCSTIFPTCSASSANVPSAQAEPEGGTIAQIKVNPTQLSNQMDHPVV